MTIGYQFEEVRFAPAHCVDADENVVTDGYVQCTQLKQVKWEGLTVKGRGDKERDMPDLTRLLIFGHPQEAFVRLRSCCLRFLCPKSEFTLLPFDVSEVHCRGHPLFGSIRRSSADQR